MAKTIKSKIVRIRKKWTPSTMKAALTAYRRSQTKGKILSIREASRMYNVAEATMRDYLAGRSVVGTKSGPQSAISPEEEEGLVKSLLDLHSKGYPATRLQFKARILDVCRDGRRHRFSRLGPSDKWIAAFILRHSDRLSMRKARILDRLRADAFDEDEMRCFFAEYQNILKDNPSIDATRIFNCDETGMDPQGGPPIRVIARRGAKSVATKRRPNRENTSVLWSVNAAGTFLPPLFIFKGKRFRSDWLGDDAPAGSRGTCTENAFIDVKVFSLWVDFFVQSIPPVRPVLLILDNHSAHVALEILEKFKANDILTLSLPPHTTHLVQPLDDGYFRAFKSKWRHVINEWAVNTRAANVQKHHIPGLVNTTFTEAWTPSIRVNSWSSTGMWPVDVEKVMKKQIPSNKLESLSNLASYRILVDDPIPLDEFNLRALRKLKRDGVIISEFRSYNIMHARMNAASRPEPAKNHVFINMTAKRLLTHDDCIAEFRLKARVKEDKMRQKAERKQEAAKRKQEKERAILERKREREAKKAARQAVELQKAEERDAKRRQRSC